MQFKQKEGAGHTSADPVQTQELSYQMSLLVVNHTQALILIHRRLLFHYETTGSYGDDTLSQTGLGYLHPYR